MKTNGSMSKAKGSNPKDILGAKKVALTALPAIAVAHGAMAMMDGARKYGPYNWRDKKVIARIYADAAKRHIDAWVEGEEYADDSKVHHLGHTIGCCAILLDAMVTGNLIDDRPITPGSTVAYIKEMKKLAETIKAKAEEIAAKKSKPKQKRDNQDSLVSIRTDPQTISVFTRKGAKKFLQNQALITRRHRRQDR